MKYIALSFAVLLMVTNIGTIKASAQAVKTFNPTVSEVYIPSECLTEMEIVSPPQEAEIKNDNPFNIDYGTISYEEWQEKKQKEAEAAQKAEKARKAAEAEKARKQEAETAKKEANTETTRSYSTSGTASTIWSTFKSWGWSDAVAAGVLGNIMAEVGGGTLSINPYLYGEGHSYYGICQWSVYYFPGVAGADLTGQLNFLHSTISGQMSGYGYDNFLSITDPSTAAYVFARYYERCASWSYSGRQRNAIAAYNSFA